ncbi:MAG: hypothetical protein LBH94_02910 [Deltaproteobacteria bacterium]|jgi:hypothetical protein|nr:hypothetical protein [Deltaproteobacteria bacterium]
MLVTTLSALKSRELSIDREKLSEHLGKTPEDDEPLALESIFASNGLIDALEACRSIEGHKGVIRLYACNCAKLVLPIIEAQHPDDQRPRKAVETAERFARGQATKKELVAAEKGALSAAWDYSDSSRIMNEGWNPKVDAPVFEAAKAVRDAVKSGEGFNARQVVEKTLKAAWYIAYFAEWSAAETAAYEAVHARLHGEFLRLCRLEGYGEVD